MTDGIPALAGAPHRVRTEDRYEHLLAYTARRAAETFHHVERRLCVLDPAARWIRAQMLDLARLDVGFDLHGHIDRPDGPAPVFADIAASWVAFGGPRPRIERDLWERLMCEWPMGRYADVTAECLDQAALVSIDRSGTARRVMEIGAGVGNLSRLLVPRMPEGSLYLRTDRDLDLACGHEWIGRSSYGRWNLDGPRMGDPMGDFDLVVAVNAFHCALNPYDALRRAASHLMPGGHLVIAEGVPETKAAGPMRMSAVPWALTASFGLMDGWWDRGGFRPESYWAAALSASARWESITVTQIYEGDYINGTHLVGHVWHAQLPD